MFDATCEQLIRLNDVPKLPWLPSLRAGKRISLATIHRWAAKGVKGRRLQTLRVGGALCTSQQWLLEFFERLGQPGPSPQAWRTPSQRQRAMASAERELASEGF